MRFSARGLALRALLDLPPPILRALSGGIALYRQGRTLDPRLQVLLERARRRPGLHTVPALEARATFDEDVRLLGGQPPRDVRVEAISIPGAAGDRPGRLYRPVRPGVDAPVVLYAHAGGGVLGGLDTDQAFCGVLAETMRAPVISLDYRLAPEHRFPAAFDDLHAAFQWARRNTGRFGGAEGRVGVAGASVGGGLAAALCHRLKAEGQAQPALQILLYPAVDLASETPSMTAFTDLPSLHPDVAAWFMAQYVGPEISPADPRLSPLRSGDFTGLAPAIVATAGFDPLVDQGDAYAARLRAAGVTTVWRRYDALCHGFASLGGAVPAAQDACREIAGLASALAAGRRAAVDIRAALS
jgi:acetyl esterase/lipase